MNRFKKYTLNIIISFTILFLCANLISYFAVRIFLKDEQKINTKINDVSISYTKSGKGLPVLLIHDFNSSSDEFGNTAADLSKSYTVISMDLPIYGSQNSKVDYNVNNLAELCNNFMSSLGYNSYYVIGHGAGANIALEMCRNYTSVQKTVLVSLKEKNLTAKPNIMTWLSNKSYFLYMIDYATKFLNLQHIDMTILEKNFKAVSRIPYESFKKAYNANFDYKSETNDKNLNGEVLIIDGKNYDEASIDYAYTLFSKHNNLKIHTIENCGYHPQIEAEKMFLSSVEEFLK